MALQDLIDRLERDADRRIAAIDDEAEAEAARIEAAAREHEMRVRAEVAERRRRQRADAFARELAVARRQARAVLLHAQAVVAKRAKARVQICIPELEKRSDYVDTLGDLLEEALHYVQGLPIQVRARPTTAGHLRPMLATRAEAVLLEDDSAPVGLVVETKDGFATVDNSIAARLERRWAELEIEMFQEVARG